MLISNIQNKELRELALLRRRENNYIGTSDCVSHVFVWEKTPEGVDFWRGVFLGQITELPQENKIEQTNEGEQTMETNKISLSEIRELMPYIGGNSLKDVMLELSERGVGFYTLLNSFKEHNLDINCFLVGNYIECDGYLYDEDSYSLTMEGDVGYTDHLSYCQYYEEFTSGDVFLVHVGRGRNVKYFSKRAIENGDFTYYDGEYYDDDAIDWHDLVCTSCGEIAHRDDVYWWESDCEYHYDPEPEPDNGYVDEYHSDLSPKFFDFSSKPKFHIGYEIEKEDWDVKSSIEIGDFREECPMWRKERDGSLDDESGFELISPTFELNTKKIFTLIRENSVLLDHVNANKSLNCGGHINVSQVNKTGAELFESIKGYTPFIHALYYKRVDKNYSKGKSNHDLINDGEKYQSIRIHSNRVEFRIISAVPNVDTLEWRTKLIHLMLKNQTSCPKEAYFLVQSKFKTLLKQMYPDDRFEVLNRRIIKFTQDFEDITINPEENN